MKRKSVLLGTVIVLSLLLISYVNQYANALGILEPPTNLTARAVSSSEIDLRWTAPSDLGGLLLTGYKIQRSTDGGSSWSTIVSNTGSTATAYSNTGLAPNTTYTYRVFAVTPLVTSSPSNTASATTASNITAPHPPTGLTATAASSSQINLGWTAPTNNGGSAITGYKIYRSTSSGTETGYVNLGNVTSYTNTGLTNGITYFYKVRAVNRAEQCRVSNEASATPPTIPSAPQNLQAAVGGKSITISWQPPSSNGGSAITGYKIYRSTSSGSETGYVTLGNVTSYTNTGLTNGVTYFYKVRAVNSVGLSLLSNEASATPVSVPSAPQNLQATAGTSNVALTWNAPSSNGGSAITGYKIYTFTSSGSVTGYVTLGNVTSYTNTGLTGGTTYFYKVRAVNSAGLSPLSNEASATPSAPTMVAPPQILTWTVNNSKQIDLGKPIVNDDATIEVKWWNSISGSAAINNTIVTISPGTYNVTWTAQDAAGNKAVAYQKVALIKTAS